MSTQCSWYSKPLITRKAAPKIIVKTNISCRSFCWPRCAARTASAMVKLLTIRTAVPGARETISYKIPAFKLNRILAYFAALKNHIGFYPPVKGDASLMKAVAPYAGEKGNLKFPLDRPIPYGLIKRIVKVRAKQNLSKTTRSK